MAYNRAGGLALTPCLCRENCDSNEGQATDATGAVVPGYIVDGLEINDPLTNLNSDQKNKTTASHLKAYLFDPPHENSNQP